MKHERLSPVIDYEQDHRHAHLLFVNEDMRVQGITLTEGHRYHIDHTRKPIAVSYQGKDVFVHTVTGTLFIQPGDCNDPGYRLWIQNPHVSFSMNGTMHEVQAESSYLLSIWNSTVVTEIPEATQDVNVL